MGKFTKIVKPLKENSTYEKQSMKDYGFPDYEYSKAGNSHIIIFKKGEPSCIISSRSNNRDTRVNYAKLTDIGITLEKFCSTKKLESTKNEYEYISNDNFDDR